MSVPELDLCILGRKNIDNFIMNQLVDLLDKIYGDLREICPRDRINVTDVALPSHKIFSVLPTGMYKIFINVRFEEKSPNMLNSTIVFQYDSVKDKLGN